MKSIEYVCGIDAHTYGIRSMGIHAHLFNDLYDYSGALGLFAKVCSKSDSTI